MKDKIIFEKYGIEFSDEDFEGVSKETLEKCVQKINATLKELKKKEDE